MRCLQYQKTYIDYLQQNNLYTFFMLPSHLQEIARINLLASERKALKDYIIERKKVDLHKRINEQHFYKSMIRMLNNHKRLCNDISWLESTLYQNLTEFDCFGNYVATCYKITTNFMLTCEA